MCRRGMWRAGSRMRESSSRARVAKHCLARWLTGQAFYRMELARFSGNAKAPDNPAHRIQDDLCLSTAYSVSLSIVLLNSVVSHVNVVSNLWSLTRGLTYPV